MRKLLFASVSALGLIGATAAFADGNTVYLDQYNVDDHASIDQGGYGNSLGNSGNHFYQNGGSSTLTVSQQGNGGWINGYQTDGGHHTATVSQGSGTTNNGVDLQQAGSYNTAVATQYSGYGNYTKIKQEYGTGLVANIWQGMGDGNIASTYQTGSANSIGTVNNAFIQWGGGNQLYASQGGNNNALTGSQVGYNNLSSTTQSGSYNSISVIQH